MPATHCYVLQCINRGNDHVINDYFQIKNMSAGRAPRYILRHNRGIKILYNFFSFVYFGFSTSRLIFYF